MLNYIIFDCYQTLIYLKNLEKIIQDFVKQEFKVNVPLKNIKRAYDLIYYRRKFQHPRFASAKDRQNFYVKYNQELLAIIDFEINREQALLLNKKFKNPIYTAYNDTRPALKYLKQNKIPLGLISNWTVNLENILKKLKLVEYFNLIRSSHGLKTEKPDPKIFANILKLLKQKYGQIYYVGNDYGLDIIPARRAGLIPILIDRENNYPDKVDCLKIKKLTELKLWV